MTVELDLVTLLCLDQRRRKRDAIEHAAGWIAKADAVLAWGHPWQQLLCLDTSRRISILTGARCGKTTGIEMRLLRRMLMTPDADCLYIALTRDAALDLMWAPLKDALERLGLTEHAHLQEVPLRCRLSNGSRLRLVGADDKKQIEKLRGIARHEVWVDEAASFDHQLLEWLLERIIGPRLGDYHGTLGIGGTPGHHLSGSFYEATRPNGDRNRHVRDRDDPKFEGWDGWSLHTWTAQEAAPFAPRIANYWADALARKKREGWSDQHPVWMREDLGLWAADQTDTVFQYRAHLDDGTAWNQWDPKRDPQTGIAILPELGRRDGWRFVHGYDLGFTDPFALEILGWHQNDESKTLYHVFEFQQTQMYARPIAELLLGKELNHEKPSGIVGALGWPDGTAVDIAGMGEALLKDLLEVYGIKLDPADKSEKFGAIELFNGDLVDGRIKILKGSVLEGELQTNQWARDDFGQRKRNKGQRDDCADAAVYARRRAHHLLAETAPTAPLRRRTEYERAGEERAAEFPAGDVPSEFDDAFGHRGYPDESDPFWG